MPLTKPYYAANAAENMKILVHVQVDQELYSK